MKKTILICNIFITSCSVSIIPLPQNGEGKKIPALFLNQDIEGFKATKDSVSFDSLKSTDPMKAQSKAIVEGIKIRGFFGLAEKGVDAIETITK
jgi:hypothetical protein